MNKPELKPKAKSIMVHGIAIKDGEMSEARHNECMAALIRWAEERKDALHLLMNEIAFAATENCVTAYIGCSLSEEELIKEHLREITRKNK